ncbi:hypothetical protein TWF694_008360 [Orbilia ellipsospora]|uniref:Uncharacterized protein n=1 Tax=Orbilia ellipsospora TaxID=2528407 RepID=A0AAV9XGG4_9PEZI
MEQDPHILILVHNTATTNTRADAQYREQALAHLQFVGTRVEVDTRDTSKENGGNIEENYLPQKRPLGFYSSDDEEDEERRKRASLGEGPVVQVESSPVYIPMSSFKGLSGTPLAYSLSPAIKSTAPELSTFICDPSLGAGGQSQNFPSQHAFTLEPVTPQTARPSISRVSETVLQPVYQRSPFDLHKTPEVPNVSVIPETVLRPAGVSDSVMSGYSSPIEYDSSQLEIPDSQPTPPRKKTTASSSARTVESDPTEDSTITHVSQSPPFAPKQLSQEHRTPSSSQAVAFVNKRTISSVIEVSPLPPSSPNQVTPTARRILQVHPPPPKFSSLSPVSPLEQYSFPETATSPDRLPQRFPLFTGLPVSPRSLLAYLLEQELASIDKQGLASSKLERQAIKTDKKRVNHYLELRQLDEYNITSPPPGVDSNPKQITPMMEKMYTQAKLEKYFCPKLFARDMKRRERGYWRMDLSRWPKPKRGNENTSRFKSTAEKKHGFWTRLAGYVKDGKLGETRLFFESENEGAGDNVGDILRLYCWGEVAIHIWIILYAISDRIVSELALQWVDSGGHLVIEM